MSDGPRPDAPLILTLALDEGAFAWFDELRRTWFPPGRNLVPAHLTLFHHLPAKAEATVADALQRACAAAPPMRLEVRGPWSLGAGVAYRLASPALSDFRARLAAAFDPWLTAQDRAPFRPHVTVQNKAAPMEARALLVRLQAEFEPFEVWGEGVRVWRYLGGPWAPVALVPFAAADAV